jgi:hypothetical protein
MRGCIDNEGIFRDIKNKNSKNNKSLSRLSDVSNVDYTRSKIFQTECVSLLSLLYENTNKYN